jgi:hypothetical protein
VSGTSRRREKHGFLEVTVMAMVREDQGDTPGSELIGQSERLREAY